jgi:DeoR/GlpR family transcriptional regulator of sugar metabolism
MDKRAGTAVEEETFRYTSAPERRDRLVDYITDQGYTTITELSAAFAVSEMTIRRDVTRLVSQGRVRGFRGGVGTLTKQDIVGSDFRFRDLKMGDAKREIAARALRLVHDHSVVAIDAGTTTNQVASMLPAGSALKVVTHSFPVVSSLVSTPGVEVICLGGTLHQESLSFDGPSTLAAIENLQVELLLLGASGVNDRGAFCANGFDAITKRALIEVAERVVLLADSSKFETPAMVKICEWDAIDSIIIDDAIQPEQERMLESNGVEVIKVPRHSTGDGAVGAGTAS